MEVNIRRSLVAKCTIAWKKNVPAEKFIRFIRESVSRWKGGVQKVLREEIFREISRAVPVSFLVKFSPGASLLFSSWPPGATATTNNRCNYHERCSRWLVLFAWNRRSCIVPYLFIYLCFLNTISAREAAKVKGHQLPSVLPSE